MVFPELDLYPIAAGLSLVAILIMYLGLRIGQKQQLRVSYEILATLKTFGADEEAEAESQDAKVYVGNIDYQVSEDELKHHFARFGEIQLVNIPVNRYSGKPRGYGFVTFKKASAAEQAITLDGSTFKGRQINVNFAKERKS